MWYLSDDPTYLAGGLGIVALFLLIALRITQQGRYLVRALIVLGLAVAVLVVEHFWVTDAERIERVVYDLRDAVQASDVDRVLSCLAPDVEFVQQGNTSSGEVTRTYIRSTLSNAKFDFVRITHLRTEAFRQSRRGTAEFRIIASGSIQGPLVQLNFGTTNSDWSLGFNETSPQVWKVDRITPTQLSSEMPGPSGSGSGSDSRRSRRFRLPR